MFDLFSTGKKAPEGFSLLLLAALSLSGISKAGWAEEQSASAITQAKPNFLFIITDDQSWEHTSKAGYGFVKTPNFDRIANEGVYFKRAYATAPSCSPSRISILTGQYIWTTKSGALLFGDWPEPEKDNPYHTFQDILATNGYFTGFTGKAWGPGFFHRQRHKSNPAGLAFNDKKKQPIRDDISVWDLPANFEDFLNAVPEDQPFSFWIGSYEPHAPFMPSDVSRFADAQGESYMPGILPNVKITREVLSSYLQEIEWFDRDLGNILEVLEKHGHLDNTVIVVTSDNGMDMPRAKPQNYEYGVRVPLAIRWGDGVPYPGRDIDDIVSLVDIAPTFLEIAGVEISEQMVGQSLLEIMQSDRAGVVDNTRNAAFSAYERHSPWRPGTETYPRRAIHTEHYVYIRNYLPDRWPAGEPPRFAEANSSLLVDETQGKILEDGSGKKGRVIKFYLDKLAQKRPMHEFYDLRADPNQFHNLAEIEDYAQLREALEKMLDTELERTGDPVHNGYPEYFEQFVTEYMMQR